MWLHSGLWKWKYTFSNFTKFYDTLSCADPESIFPINLLFSFAIFSGPDSVGFPIEADFGYNQAEDTICPKANPSNSSIPPDVKVAIKAMYVAGVTKPREIMKSLVEEGVTEEGSFKIGNLYNFLKKNSIKWEMEKWR